MNNFTNSTWHCKQDSCHSRIGSSSSLRQTYSTHATKCVDEKLTIESFQMLDWSMLKELGVIWMREALCILKQAKEATTQRQPVFRHWQPSSPLPQSWDDSSTIQEVPNWLEHLYYDDFIIVKMSQSIWT